jgi:hypothetical protein
MKKGLLVFLCFTLPFLVFSQRAQRENVLVEITTGTW